MHVIGHDDESVQNDRGKSYWKAMPDLLNHHPRFIELKVAVTNCPKTREADIKANGDKVWPRQRVIELHKAEIWASVRHWDALHQ